MKLRRWIAIGSLVLSSALAGPVFAQDEPDATPNDRAQAFEAATGPQTENLPGGTMVVVAYGLVWLVLLGFVASIGVRQATTNRKLEELRKDLASRDE